MSQIITFGFIAEAALKIITMGFTFGQHTYLRDPWNVLDFLIVVFSILNMILEAAIKNNTVSFLSVGRPHNLHTRDSALFVH